jgi:Myb-like DNA-binding domain
LLLKWSQSILDVPTLVRLGYGGVPSPIVEKDEDDVSSWGSNNNNNTNVMGGNDVLTSTTISVDERKQPQRRRKSRTYLTKALNTEKMVRQQPQNRSYSITAEEHDIIARLAATARVPTHQESVEVAAAVNSPIAKSKGMDDMVTTNQNEFEAESGTAELYPALNAEHKNLNNGTPVVRKVVKASRRLLTSFNFALTSNNGNNGTLEHGTEMTNNVRNDSMANRSFMFSTNNNIMDSTSKKRTASECLDANLSIAFDDATRPEIIRRRNNIWAMNQRMKMRMKKRKEQNTDNASPMLDITTIHNSDGNSKNENSLTQTTPSRNGNTMLAKSPTSSVKKQQRRTFFTEVEVQALRDGIQKYGAGKWSVIQKNDVRLQGRTPIQLKDKYRNIVSIISSSSLPPPTVTKD